MRQAQIALYNAGGYLTRQLDRRGLVREFEYDNLGRNTAEIWYNSPADADMDTNRQNTLSFSYDAVGQLLSAGDASATYDYSYDRLGRMITSDTAIAGLTPTVTLTNAYNATGQRVKVAATIGADADFITDYAYDPLGRTISIQQDAAPTSVLPVAEKRVDITYDAASQPQTLTRYADLSATQQVAATDYLFDQAGRLTGMAHAKNANILADYDWTFDEANRMTRFESLIDGIVDYTNDDTDQLTGADYTAGAGLPTAPPDEQYVYDENGNRINNGYTVGPNNQLLSDAAHTYTYDQEGNRTSKTNISTGESVEYTWDHRNRLTKVTFKDATGTETKIVEYAYDYGQRWVRKTLDTNADGTTDESRIFIHDADASLSLRERAGVRTPQIVLDFENAGTGDVESTDLSHRYLWGTNVDQILADESVDDGTADDVAWPLTDHLNTVRDLVEYAPATDTTSVIKHITYDAFGQITSDSAPSVESLFLFTARPYDGDSELQNNLNRWCDLSTGRWMSMDPIGFHGEDMNLSRFVRNSPGLLNDPTGLEPPDTYWSPTGNMPLPYPRGRLSPWWSVKKVGIFPILTYIGQNYRLNPSEPITASGTRRNHGGYTITIGTKDATQEMITSTIVHEAIGGPLAGRLKNNGENVDPSYHNVAIIAELGALASLDPTQLTAVHANKRYATKHNGAWGSKLDEMVRFINDCEQGKRDGERWEHTETWDNGWTLKRTVDREELRFSIRLTCKNKCISNGSTFQIVFYD